MPVVVLPANVRFAYVFGDAVATKVISVAVVLVKLTLLYVSAPPVNVVADEVIFKFDVPALNVNPVTADIDQLAVFIVLEPSVIDLVPVPDVEKVLQVTVNPAELNDPANILIVEAEADNALVNVQPPPTPLNMTWPKSLPPQSTVFPVAVAPSDKLVEVL